MEVTTYHARVERGERYWMIYVPEVDRSTQARKLSEVDEMARDLVAVMEDLDPDSVDIDVSYVLPTDVVIELSHADELRKQAADANSAAAQSSRTAVRKLLARGVSQREAATVLGMSFQRVHQLANPDQTSRAAKPTKSSA